MQKPLVFSFTFLNTWLICPYQCYRRYILKNIPFKETAAMRYGNEVHTALEHRINGNKMLPVEMQQWEPFAQAFIARGAKAEMKMGLTIKGQPTGFFDKDVWLRGKVDVTIVAGYTGFIPDWKTGKPREDSFELEVEALFVKSVNRELQTIKGAYIWLKENRMGQIHDLSDCRSTWAKVNEIAEEINSCVEEQEFEKKRSPLCAWCDCFDCENNTNPERPR